MKTVAVIGSSDDEHTRYVAEAVRRRRARVVLIDTGRVPESATLSWEQGAVRYQAESLEDIRSFYLKRVQLSLPLPDPSGLPERNFSTWQEQYIAERERQSFLMSVLRGLPRRGRSFVNPVETIELHALKLHQIELLQSQADAHPARLGIVVGEAAFVEDDSVFDQFGAHVHPAGLV